MKVTDLLFFVKDFIFSTIKPTKHHFLSNQPLLYAFSKYSLLILLSYIY